MAISNLDMANRLLKKRKFVQAIQLLEDHEDDYRDDFEYYITMAIACLYNGEFGIAKSYFNTARKYKLNDTRLYLGQAVLFLREGRTDEALSYYLDVVEMERNNKTAKLALDFIKVHGDYDTICRWVDSGKIKAFYPPLGFNADPIVKGLLLGILAGAIFCGVIYFVPKLPKKEKAVSMSVPSFTPPPAKDLAKFDELKTQKIRYTLTPAQIKEHSDTANVSFLNGQDNLTRVEVNLLLASNADDKTKLNAYNMLYTLEQARKDSPETHKASLLKDTENFTYDEVANDPKLYENCYVNWTGVIKESEGKTGFDFMLGEGDMTEIKGTVPIYIKAELAPKIKMGAGIRVWGIVAIDNDDFILKMESFTHTTKSK